MKSKNLVPPGHMDGWSCGHISFCYKNSSFNIVFVFGKSNIKLKTTNHYVYIRVFKAFIIKIVTF